MLHLLEYQYIKDYKVGRIDGQQWEGRWSTVRWLMINTFDCWSWGGINSQQWEGQWSTVRQLTVNSEAIDDQHCWLLILGGSTVNSERVDGQQWGNQWSTLLTVDLGGQINSQQWEGWQLTVRQLTINTVDCWSWGHRSTVNSERVDSQQWGNWWSTLLTVDPGGDQQSTVRGSTVSNERVNGQQSM